MEEFGGCRAHSDITEVVDDDEIQEIREQRTSEDLNNSIIFGRALEHKIVLERKDKLPHEARQMAEAQEQRGVAFTYYGQFDEALKQFNNVIQIINGALEELEEIDVSRRKQHTNVL